MRQRKQRHFLSILRDTLLEKAMQYMAKSNYLEGIVTGMSAHEIDPYSAVEEVVAAIMPDCID